MTTYHCDGFQPIKQGALVDVHGEGFKTEIGTAEDAARAFALRFARRKFGRSGFCNHVRLDCYTQNGRNFNFEAFVGRPWQGNGCSGLNEWFYVTVRE